MLDLHSNRLQGKNPILLPNAAVVDYSLNYFTSIPISTQFSETMYFSLSRNQLNEEIPMSICQASYLEVLDLSYNNLSGHIPSCLGSMASLQVLDLRGNNLQGTIPGTFPQNCNLKTLNMNGNNLDGRLPRSLANCTLLEVLDVGNNQLSDTFPSWLGSRQKLRILVLRSNKFYGLRGNDRTECNFPTLQIIDISSNNFSGVISKECFASFKAMMVSKEETEWKHNDQIIGFVTGLDMYYQQTVTVTVKALDLELVKIQTIFTSIDFSNNRFKGEIPETIGNLASLYILNFSSNALTGTIPPTLGNLTNLESLDLSSNKLTGEIPSQLASLSFLSILKLSFNKLVGRIPSGNQFQTFPPNSFEGNDKLCGYPLSKNCSNAAEAPPQNVSYNNEDEFDWVLLAVTFCGFLVGASIFIGPQYFSKKARHWCHKFINRICHIS
ncbi:hypothetical protein MKW92_001533 [Papaver armeniacum]|nr:hypothetical protein MKW92_001533 [Papaver armeniacum]